MQSHTLIHPCTSTLVHAYTLIHPLPIQVGGHIYLEALLFLFRDGLPTAPEQRKMEEFDSKGLPACKREIQMEVALFERRIRELEAAAAPKAEVALLWMETVARKDAYRVGYGTGYDPPLETSRSEKV